MSNTDYYIIFSLVIGLIICIIIIYLFYKRYRLQEEQDIINAHLDAINEHLTEINKLFVIVDSKKSSLNLYTGQTKEKTLKSIDNLENILIKLRESKKLLEETKLIVFKNLKKAEQSIINVEDNLEQVNKLLKEVENTQLELQKLEENNNKKITEIYDKLEEIDKPNKKEIKAKIQYAQEQQYSGDIYGAFLILEEINLILNRKEETNLETITSEPIIEEAIEVESHQEISLLQTELELPQHTEYKEIEVEKEEEIIENVIQESSTEEEISPENLPEVEVLMEEKENNVLVKEDTLLTDENENNDSQELSQAISTKQIEISDTLEKEQDKIISNQETDLESVTVSISDTLIDEATNEETLQNVPHQEIESKDVEDVEDIKSSIDESKQLNQEIEILDNELKNNNEDQAKATSDKSIKPEEDEENELEKVKLKIQKIKTLISKSIDSKNIEEKLVRNSLNSIDICTQNTKKIKELEFKIEELKQEIINISKNEFELLFKYFIPFLWEDVSENLMKADKLLNYAISLIEIAKNFNTQEVKKYYRADINLQRAENKIEQAYNYCAQIKDKLSYLLLLKEEYISLFNELNSKIEELEQDNVFLNNENKEELEVIITKFKNIKYSFDPEEPYDYITNKNILNDIKNKLEKFLE